MARRSPAEVGGLFGEEDGTDFVVEVEGQLRVSGQFPAAPTLLGQLLGGEEVGVRFERLASHLVIDGDCVRVAIVRDGRQGVLPLGSVGKNAAAWPILSLRSGIRAELRERVCHGGHPADLPPAVQNPFG